MLVPVVPTECDVLIVCRQHNDKEWKFKEQHAKMWENIAGTKRYSRPCGFNIAGASAAVAPAVPTPLSLTGMCSTVLRDIMRRLIVPALWRRAPAAVACCVMSDPELPNDTLRPECIESTEAPTTLRRFAVASVDCLRIIIP